jgi:prepilin-type N-terminal cleavage/methylation domain-containing protein
MPPPHPSPARNGFSLIELLVAMSITSLIMVALMSLIGQSSSIYRESRNAVQSLSDARSMLQFFEAELASRLPRTPLLTDSRDGGPDMLGYIRAGSFDEQLLAPTGDLSTSVYYVAFSADAPGSVSPKLFRHHLDASKTQDLLESPAPPAMPSVDPATDEPLLHNVIRFEAKPKLQGPAGNYQPWTPDSRDPPAAIEITIEIIDDATAARFKSQASWLALRDRQQPQSTRFIRRFSRIIPVVP